DQGSIFTVYMPKIYSPENNLSDSTLINLTTHEFKPSGSRTNALFPKVVSERADTHREDDRDNISENDKTILIIEDDEHFAEVLAKAARKAQYKVLVGKEGKEGMELAANYAPKGIILDI